MGMFSEAATSATIEAVVKHIRDELKTEANPAACAALRRVGRFALTRFEWDRPQWAQSFEVLFADREE